MGGGGSTKHSDWHLASSQLVLVPFVCPELGHGLGQDGQLSELKGYEALGSSLPPHPSQTSSWSPSSPSQPQTATKLMKLKGFDHVGIFICKYKTVSL